ncbi:MAG TPA: sensor histidine kinase, partial [Terriglobales bacterium]
MSLSLDKGRNSANGANAASAQAMELSRQLVRAQEDERKRISRELHDGTGQGLMVLRLYLALLGSSSRDRESQLKVQEALGLLDRTIEDLRRIISRLSPRALEQLGVLTAIRKEVREVSHNSGIKAHLDLPKHLGDLDHEIELAIYRSVQEALHNITKHAKAQNLSIRLARIDGVVHLYVQDDGVGFSRKRSTQKRAFGLWGLRERIAALGGKLRISSADGQGTRLRVTLPVKSAPQHERAVGLRGAI